MGKKREERNEGKDGGKEKERRRKRTTYVYVFNT